MGPNVQHYDFTHRWVDLCKMTTCSEIHAPKVFEKGTLMNILETTPEFSKMLKIVKMARQENLLNKQAYYNSKHTLLLAENKHIPDAFMNTLDFDKAFRFVRAYILRGTVTINYLLENGSSIYTPFNTEAPMLATVVITSRPSYEANVLHRTREMEPPQPSLKGEITINKVGKVLREIKTTNGVIIVMDNMADI